MTLYRFLPLIRLAFSIAIAIAIVQPNRALAEETDAEKTAGTRQVSFGLGIPDALDFQGYAGVATGIFPEYEGGDDATATVLPLADIRQEDFLFIRGASTNLNDGNATVGWNALNLGYDERGDRKFRLSTGPLVRYYRGRDEDDSGALNGLGDIDDSVSIGGFLEIRAGGWHADLAAVSRATGETDEGLLMSFRSGYTAHISDRLSIAPGIFASWGDDDYMQGVFGVNATQAARSGLSRFNAGSGVKDAGIDIRANYEISRNVLVSGEIGYQRLLGDAADSPIVDGAGSPDQFRVLIGAAYKF